MTREEFEALPADFYDACDSKEFLHTAIENAIAEVIEVLDSLATPDCDTAGIIHERGPVEVRALQRMPPVEDSWYAEQTTRLLGELVERWCEDYGDPDDLVDTAPALALARPLMDAAVRAFVAASNPWQCVEVGRYRYSAEEVEAMMRAHNPDWFEAAPAASAP